MTIKIKAPYAHKYFNRRIERSDVEGPLIGHDHFGPIDWEKVVREANWEEIHDIDWWDGNEYAPELLEGLIDGKTGIHVVPLHLSLTHADWQSIRRKCRKAYTEEGWGFGFVLQGNLLFVIGSGGACTAIFRFAACENRYEVVEIAHLAGDICIWNEWTEWFSESLARLLPGNRFGKYRSETDEDGWYWREPGDPGYFPE